jgi:hypothetical protein
MNKFFFFCMCMCFMFASTALMAARQYNHWNGTWEEVPDGWEIKYNYINGNGEVVPANWVLKYDVFNAIWRYMP